MWSSLPAALMALVVLSNSALAQVVEIRTIAISACLAPTHDGSSPSGDVPETASGVAGSPASGGTMSTLAVVPIPMSTVAGVFPSGMANGSRTIYPTASGSGFSSTNLSSESITQPISVDASSTQSTESIPFFRPTITEDIPLPTAAPDIATQYGSSIVDTITLSVPLATFKPSTKSSEAPPTETVPSTIPFLRGVNLGGWLVIEKWMTEELFTGDFSNAVDQWSFDSVSGAKAALEKHWSTYFTEADIKKIASTGMNALRIPIGYWAYNNTGTPYHQGADAYLEKAIGWARSNGMKVWVDCHGSPGSQNGYAHSGHEGQVEWQQGSNQEVSIQVLQTMAKKYGAQEYADVVVGLEMVNEPVHFGNNDFGTMQIWSKQAFKAIKAEVENKDLVIVMHDAFQGPEAWDNVAESLLSNLGKHEPKTFGIDTHMYQVFNDNDNVMTQHQHIVEACAWGHALGISNLVAPTYVGEWAAVTNICVNPDGSTTAGLSCNTEGCQCTSADFDTWNEQLVAQTRRFVEAQMDTFEAKSSGWFAWSAKGPGGWGFLNGIEKGTIPNPVTARKFPGQCGKKRREVRGDLGRTGEVW